MINEKKLAELRKYERDPGFAGYVFQEPLCSELLDTLSALWKVARAAENVEDMLEVNPRLGANSQMVFQKAIDDFREALAALRGTEEK